METQKTVNLRDDTDNKSSKFLLTIKTMDNMAEKMKMMQPLNLIHKLLSQIFVITQIHILL